jgi:hypothetical protein
MVNEKENSKGVDETHRAQLDVFTTYLPIVGYSCALFIHSFSKFRPILYY